MRSKHAFVNRYACFVGETQSRKITMIKYGGLGIEGHWNNKGTCDVTHTVLTSSETANSAAYCEWSSEDRHSGV